MSASSDFITIMAWDVGEKHLTWFIEKISLSKLRNLSKDNIPLTRRYDKNGECTQEFAKVLTKLYLLGQRVSQGQVDLTTKDDKKWGRKRIIDNKFLIRLTNYLEDMNESGLLSTINYFIIEEQVKKADNNRIIQFHIRSYLLMLFLSFKPIICFSATHKTKVLGAPKKLWNEKKQQIIKMDKSARKKWASDKCLAILSERNDMEGLAQIFAKQGRKKVKSDDYADCLLHILSWSYLVFVDGQSQYQS